MHDKPDTCAPCPLYQRGRGFVLPWGDPRSKLSFCGEGPGPDEVLFRLELDDHEHRAEFERRKRLYPTMDERFLLRGRPFCGKTGRAAEAWVLRPLGLEWGQHYVGNVLCCLPPKYGKDHYPTGDDRKAAEACCAQYARWDSEVKPELAVVGIHPAALLREITPLPLLIRAVEKARDAAQGGIRTVMLLGGKAAKRMLGYAENSTKWCGSFSFLERGRG